MILVKNLQIMFQDVLRKKETFLDDKNYTIKKDPKPEVFAGINP